MSDGDFEGGLYGLDGVGVGGEADAEAVVEEGCVAGFGHVVCVGIIGREEIPVGRLEPIL